MRITVNITPEFLREVLVYECADKKTGNNLPDTLTRQQMEAKVIEHFLATSEHCRAQFGTDFTEDEKGKVIQWVDKLTQRVK